MSKKLLQAVSEANKTRAQAYYFLYKEMEKKIGKESAVEIFKNAMYKMGKEKSSKKYSNQAKENAEILAEEFVNKDKLHKDLFQKKKVKAEKNECEIQMYNCPLVEKWQEMKLAESEISLLCDLAYQIDYGTFETLGYKLEFLSRCADGDNCCHLHLIKN